MRSGSSIYERNDGRWEARYRKGISADGKAVYASVYGRTREEADAKRAAVTGKQTLGEKLAGTMHRELNLLILGVGSHGRNVMEIAESLGVFQKISFLDDSVTGDRIIGRCSEAVDFLNEYPCAFIAIGNNKVRKKYAAFLREKNFILPRIISPGAIISKDAHIGEGTVVLPQATIGAANIGSFCIIASNALVNAEAEVGDFAHIDCGGIVMKKAKVNESAFLESGGIWK